MTATHTTHTWRDCTPYITPADATMEAHELDMQCRCDVCYSNAMDILYDRERTWKWSEDGTNTKTHEGVRHGKGMLEWEYFRELKEKGNLVKCLTLRPTHY